MRLFDSISDTNNSLMEDLGKFTHEQWGSYLIAVLAVVLGGVLSAIWGWPFAVFVPLLILWVGFVAQSRYRRKLAH